MKRLAGRSGFCILLEDRRLGNPTPKVYCVHGGGPVCSVPNLKAGIRGDD